MTSLLELVPRQLLARAAGHAEDTQARLECTGALSEVHAVHGRQDHIRQQQMELSSKLAADRHRLIRSACRDYAISMTLEHAAGDVPKLCVVLDQQDGLRATKVVIRGLTLGFRGHHFSMLREQDGE